jgi:hypothetical protein
LVCSTNPIREGGHFSSFNRLIVGNFRGHLCPFYRDH